jgi:hypothetical protein
MKVKRPSLLPDPSIPDHALGVDENDLWIVATAIAHDVTVVSNDVGIDRIIEVARAPAIDYCRIRVPVDGSAASAASRVL